MAVEVLEEVRDSNPFPRGPPPHVADDGVAVAGGVETDPAPPHQRLRSQGRRRPQDAAAAARRRSSETETAAVLVLVGGRVRQLVLGGEGGGEAFLTQIFSWSFGGGRGGEARATLGR